MPTHPLPQPSTRESPGKQAQPPADAPPSGPDATTAKPARQGALFHLLMERGWEAGLAYTADQRIRTMTSEIAAAGLQPVLAELRQIRESLAGFATKSELQAEVRQIRESLAGFATKSELQAEVRQMRESMATKVDLEKLETNLRREMAERDVRLIKWVFGALLAQAALVVGLVTLLT